MVIIGALYVSADTTEVIGGVCQWLLSPPITALNTIDGLRTINGFIFLLPHTILDYIWIEN